MRDLMARLASLPPEARTMAFKRFDQVLAELFELFSPPEFEGSVDDLQRDLNHVERLERAASLRLGEAGPVKGADPVSLSRKGGLG